MMPRTFYVHVYGCQMNKLDGQLVADRLRAAGMTLAETPQQADLRLYVTCSVRKHAEDRVYSNVGKLKHLRRRRNGLLVGILGCMAEKDREEIFRRLPHVDFICGPNELDRLDELIRAAAEARGPAPSAAGGLAALSPPRTERAHEAAVDRLEALEAVRRSPTGEHAFHAYVRAMRGCDNFCAYCIVPFVRGPEASRAPRAILGEVRQLAEQGVRHVTLLGQSIGSYRREEDGRLWGLAELVREAARIDGLLRLDFVTMHPRTLTDALLDRMADGEPVATYLHMPAQSGADRVLKAMSRGYTAQEYRRLVERARAKVRGVAVASDFIVGFPGETDDDFRATLSLVRQVEFSQVFAFKYSPRPGTAAARLKDDVPATVKTERLDELLKAHAETAARANAALVGRTVRCLVTGRSPKPHLDDPTAGNERLPQFASRDPGNRIVVFHGPDELIGRIVPVRITRASAVTLFGKRGKER